MQTISDNLFSDAANSFAARYQKYTRWGFITCTVFFVLIISSASVICIAGAVTALGKVVQTGKNKEVQHPIGGPVSHILIKNGDLVKKGDPLIVLDSVQITSQHTFLNKREFELTIALERLDKMQNYDMDFSVDTEKYAREIQAFPDIVDIQQSIYLSRRDLFNAATSEFKTRIDGLQQERQALEQQIKINKEQLIFLNQSIAEVKELFNRQLVAKTRLTNLERDRVSVLAQIESLQVSKTRSINAYNEAQKALNRSLKENQETVWREIEATKGLLTENNANLESISDQQSRLVISAPASGRIHELAINNIDAVVQPGETIMQIVPINAGPTISARVTPQDIEQVTLEQETRIRFDSLDASKTPEIVGKVINISPDSSTDDATGEIYFAVTVELPEEEIQRIRHDDIIPGMPVSAMFTTNKRTLMNYLLKPFSKQLFAAFRES